MNHAVLTEYLADYLEGDLALDKRALVDAHLDTCASCAQEVREMQQTIRLLRALPEPEMPPMIAANVMRRIRAGETQPSFLERIQRKLGGVLEPSFVLPASAIAVAALVFAVVQDGGPLSRSLRAARGAEPTIDFARPGEPNDAEPSSERAVAGLAAEAGDGATIVGQDADRGFGASAVASASDGADAPARHPSADAASAFATHSASTTASISAAASEEAFESTSLADSAVEASFDEARRERARAAGDPMGAPTWAAQRPGAAGARGGRAGAYFDQGGLAQGFARDGRGPATGFFNGQAGDPPTAVPVTLSRNLAGEPGRGVDTGGEDARDVWLARALEDPSKFARFIAGHNLAEQELWVERLGERAQSRGLLGELIDALRAARDEKASWLADDFEAQAQSAASGGTSGQERPGQMDEAGGASGR